LTAGGIPVFEVTSKGITQGAIQDLISVVQPSLLHSENVVIIPPPPTIIIIIND